MPEIHSGESGRATAWYAGFTSELRRRSLSFQVLRVLPVKSPKMVFSAEGKKKNGSSALSRDSGRQNCQSPKREASMLCALAESELLVSTGGAEVICGLVLW